MFTGIIEEIGCVRSLIRTGTSFSLKVEARRVLEGTRIGDSIATNGVCLTVTHLHGDGFTADVMPATVERTALGALRPGSRVNLERALALGARLGGHLVSGHVDALGTLLERRTDETALRLTWGTTAEALRYIVAQGSIAIDGVSLTVVSVAADRFTVSLIPHTQGETTLHNLPVGAQVNLECDLIARYVERLLGVATPMTRGGLTEEMLRAGGFM